MVQDHYGAFIFCLFQASRTLFGYAHSELWTDLLGIKLQSSRIYEFSIESDSASACDFWMLGANQHILVQVS